MDNEEYGRRVLTLSAELGLSQHSLAEKMGKDRVWLNKIVLGKKGIARDSELALLNALECSLEELHGDTFITEPAALEKIKRHLEIKMPFDSLTFEDLGRRANIDSGYFPEFLRRKLYMTKDTARSLAEVFSMSYEEFTGKADHTRRSTSSHAPPEALKVISRLEHMLEDREAEIKALKASQSGSVDKAFENYYSYLEQQHGLPMSLRDVVFGNMPLNDASREMLGGLLQAIRVSHNASSSENRSSESE